MYYRCDACQSPLGDDVVSFLVQRGRVVQMTDGSMRMQAGNPNYHVLCTECGDRMQAAMDQLHDSHRTPRAS